MAPYLVLLGTQNLDERTIQDLTGNMNAILGFHPTSSEKIAATKWRYDMFLKMYIGLIPRPPPPPPEEWDSLVSGLYFSRLSENGSGHLPIPFSFKCAGRVNNLLAKWT